MATTLDTGDGLLQDVDRGLTWVADPQMIVTTGLAESLVLSRVEALGLVSRINAGEVDNFGYSDWRIPTARELEDVRHLLELSELDRLMAPLRDSVVLWPVRGYSTMPGFADVSVFATNSVRLKNGAAVLSGDVIANDASPGPTLTDGFEIGLDPQASTAAGFSVEADSLRVKNNATVGGDAAYNDLDNKGTIAGTQTSPLSLPVFALLPVFFAQAPAPGSADVVIPDDGFVVLPEGDYGDVVVGRGGTVVFTGGTYNVASIDADKEASILFRAPARVRVAGRFFSDKDGVVGPEAGSGITASDVVFYVSGINGSDGALDSTPRAAEIGMDSVVDANFYAPNGLIRVGHGAAVTGALLARDVLVENGAQISLDSFFSNLAPQPVDDSATVDEGGTVSILDSGDTSVLDNDSDPNPTDTLTVTTTPVSGPANGTLTLNADGTFSYTHDGGETTSDAFVYEVCDDGIPVECATATVSITVNPVNDPPVAVGDSATVNQGQTVSVLDSGATSVLANDSDPDSTTLTVTTTPVSGPDHGTLVLNADGTFSYANDGNENISDAFVYEVCDDGVPVACSTATVSITIIVDGTINITKFGLGSGTVTSSPAGINCGPTCGADFPGGTVVTLTAVASGTSVFSGFSGDPDCADGVVTAEGVKTCLARFDASAVPAVLTVTTAGSGSGNVTSSPAGIDCPASSCSAGYPIPTRVDLTATADAGSTFVGWTGNADCADGSVAMTADLTCTANFELQPATLTVTKIGLGDGTVTSSPAGIDCGSTCSASFPGVPSVTLTATPSGTSVFAGFSGHPDCADGVITPDADKTCFARFDEPAAGATVTVSLAGTGSGQVTSSPAGIDCPATACSASFTVPASVSLTPVADAGSVFAGWSGDADCSDGNLRVSGNISCTATFNLDAGPTLRTISVVFQGGGEGTVAISPPGISCSSDCSGTVSDGATVTLSLRPSAGTFAGWAGDCSGTGFVTSVLMDADKTCIAIINL